MHTFVHPLSAAVDPVWESKSDWETYKTIAKRFSELAKDHLAVGRVLHVRNAPSPAATSALAIGSFIAERAESELGVGAR
jgi:nitrate reductase alpha subunit